MPLLVKFGIDDLQTSVETSLLSLGITYRFSKASKVTNSRLNSRRNSLMFIFGDTLCASTYALSTKRIFVIVVLIWTSRNSVSRICKAFSYRGWFLRAKWLCDVNSKSHRACSLRRPLKVVLFSIPLLNGSPFPERFHVRS